jgi:hypothetical protein
MTTVFYIQIKINFRLCTQHISNSPLYSAVYVRLDSMTSDLCLKSVFPHKIQYILK